MSNRKCFRFWGVFILFGLSAANLSGQIGFLHSFTGGASDGANPYGSLVLLGSSLYGMTPNGGTPDMGTVFKIQTDGTGFTLLHTFAEGPGDGRLPYGSLVSDGAVLYGMTQYGGTWDYGTIFKINADGTGYVILRSFGGGPLDGGYPAFGSLALIDSTLYGMTSYGGSTNFGTLFKIATDGTGFAVLHHFSGGHDGKYPYGSLTVAGRVLYGLTPFGGDVDFGTLFQYDTLSTMYTSYHVFAGGPADGSSPYGSVVLIGNTIYGSTTLGGDGNDGGTLFKINDDRLGYARLIAFGGSPAFQFFDGRVPWGGPIAIGSRLYLMTQLGGTFGFGMIYRYDTVSGMIGFIYSFTGGSGDGRYPRGSLVTDGTMLYGMTQRGGTQDAGAIISFNVDPRPRVTTSPVTAITTMGATSGGNVTGSGDSSITARGVCWNTAGSPTLADPHTNDPLGIVRGTVGMGVYTSLIGGLQPSTTYHVRAYASNGYGAMYGQDIAFQTAAILSYTISGAVADGTTPLAGATVTFSHDGHIETTSAGGFFFYAVPPGTTTTFTPRKPGYFTWTPASRTLVNVQADSRDQNFGTLRESFAFAYAGSWTEKGKGWDGWQIGDFNGDGKADIFRYLPGVSGADVFLSDGAKFVAAGSWTGAGHGAEGWYLGDFNGDGKTDILRVIPGTGVGVFLSNGSQFIESGIWTAAGSGSDGWYVGDFNGDGKADIMRYMPGVGSEVFLSDGTRFVSAGIWTGAGYGSDGWHWGDFNGDGKTDLFRTRVGIGIEVFLSDGTRFTAAGAWTDADGGSDGWYVGDFNGDGRDDIFRYLPGTSGADVFLSDGSQFVSAGSWTGAGNAADGWFLGDFNGDGRCDIFRYLLGVSGADVFLASNSGGAAAGAIDRIMAAAGQASDPAGPDFWDEEKWLAPFREKMLAGEHGSMSELKKSYETLMGKSITRPALLRLLRTHDFKLR